MIRQAPALFGSAVVTVTAVMAVIMFLGFAYYYSAQGERLTSWREKAESYERLFPGKTAEEIAQRIDALEEQLSGIVDPKVKEISREEKDNPDGTHSVILTLQIYTKPLPAKMRAGVIAEGLISVEPSAGGLYNMTPVRDHPEGKQMQAIEITPPIGDFSIEIKTKAKTEVSIGYSFAKNDNP